MQKHYGLTGFGGSDSLIFSIAWKVTLAVLLLTGRFASAEETEQFLRPIERQWISSWSFGPSQKDKASEPIEISIEKPSVVGLVFVVRYRAKNQSCTGFKPVLFLETGNGWVPLEFIEIYHLPDGVTSKTFTISVDKYEPGHCLWQPVSIEQGEYSSQHQSFSIGNFGYHGAFFLDDTGPKVAEFDSQCRDFTYPDKGKFKTILSCGWPHGGLEPSKSHLINSAGTKLMLRFSMGPPEQWQPK
ncbi:hypothetical protein [Paraburkholderia sediminicola]|uniref:hypothetical protein n=1 Tax=Paraburkholderia sediminicola TaxID=458836 RepID=UPI0038BA592E